MATLAELYEYLEKKRDNKHIEKVFLYDTFYQKNNQRHDLRFFYGGKLNSW